jgi:hypothetical protein
MFSKPQVQLLKAMKLLESVLEGKDTDKAQQFVSKWRGRVESAGDYIRDVESSDDHMNR